MLIRQNDTKGLKGFTSICDMILHIDKVTFTVKNSLKKSYGRYFKKPDNVFRLCRI